MKNNKGFVGLYIVIGILIAGVATYVLVQRSVLKSFFQTGDKPSQDEKKLAPTIDVGGDVKAEVSGDKPTSAQFNNMIDSSLNIADDKVLSGLKEYDSTKSYQVGDTLTDTSAGGS